MALDESTGDPDREPAEPAEGDLDEGALYVGVRRAVEDAILGVIGTLLLVGAGLVLVWVGVAIAIDAGTRPGVVPLLGGVAVAVVGLYVAAATLEVIPPIREWFSWPLPKERAVEAVEGSDRGTTPATEAGRRSPVLRQTRPYGAANVIVRSTTRGCGRQWEPAATDTGRTTRRAQGWVRLTPRLPTGRARRPRAAAGGS